MNILHRLFYPAFWLLVAVPGYAQSLVVNSSDDTNDGACNALHCSLREAIATANQNPGPDTITFSIPGPLPAIISPLSPLPFITGAGTVIDGATQSGAIGGLLLDGVNAGAAADGMVIGAANCAVYGMHIRRFSNGLRITGSNARIGAAGKGNVTGGNTGAGILLAGGSSNAVIHGNMIGTSPLGNTADPNGQGIFVEGQASAAVTNVSIGGLASGQGNLIGGNTGDGIHASHVANFSVSGNLIGLNLIGITILPNGGHGIHVENSNSVNIGDGALGTNLIAGNTGHGIHLEDIPTGARIDGNLIGLSVNGTAIGNGANGIWAQRIPLALITGNTAIANGANGLEVWDTEGLFIRNNSIGLDALSNVPAGNEGAGIVLHNCSSFEIEDNTICDNQEQGMVIQMWPGIAPADGLIISNRVGLFENGPDGAGNGGFGIQVSQTSNLLIGGSATEGNQIGGNGAGGIRISNSLDVILQRNSIGTNANESLALGNAGPGILIDSLSEGILAGGFGFANAIAHNEGYGVHIASEATSCTISQNHIFCNAQGGIQVDPGANDDASAPAAICAGPNSVEGVAGPFSIVEIFLHDHQTCAAPPCQGRILAASTLAGADGRWSVPAALAPGDTITATATNLLGSTSPFSACVTVQELPVATASNDGPACEGSAVQLIGTAWPDTPENQYDWMGPGAFSAQAPSPAGNFPAGMYTLTVSRGFCRSAPDTTEVIRLALGSGRLEDTLCHGQSVSINGRIYDATNAAGTEILAGAAANGCDSVLQILLSFFPPSSSEVSSVICPGDSVVINGTVYGIGNPSGVEVLAGAAVNGCDSILAINLSFLPPAESQLQFDICPDESVTINGAVYDANRLSGVELIPGGSTQGCDSIIRVDLRLLDAPEFMLNRTICPEEQIEVNGVLYGALRTTGTEVLQGAAANGCDSIVRIQLTVDTLSLTVNLQAAHCSLREGGAITITSIEGGTPPYTLTINSSPPVVLGPLPNVTRGLAPGAYAVVISDSSRCAIRSQVIIPDSALFSLQPDTTIRLRPGRPVRLGPEWGFVPDFVLWSPAERLSCSDCPNPSITPFADQTYQVTAMHQGCTAQQLVRLLVQSETPVYAPTAFSPNGDGINDRFTLYGDPEEVLQIISLHIFDRWGGLVYEGSNLAPNQEAAGWDGKAHGKACSAGTYLFVAEVETAFGEVMPVRGAFQILH